MCVCGSSVVDISNRILIGRPYGGTAILCRKTMANRISIVPYNDSRLTAVNLHTCYGPVLIISVY